MKLVLLSGGTGRRLFPLSNDVRSKQFLRVLSGENGNMISMLQRVWGQIQSAGLESDAYICAGKAHKESITNQLGNVQVIDEPCTRDTFPAIALSTSFLLDVEGCSDDDVVVFMPVDPYVGDDFFEAIKSLKGVLERSGANIALLGVTPTEPSTQYGYIVPTEDRGNRSWVTVNSFVEKPTLSDAERLIADGALWNCGVFALRISLLGEILNQHDVNFDYLSIKSSFHLLPKISFDYEVLEKTAQIVAVPFSGSWNDIGTWDILSKHMAENLTGVGRVVESVNTHVINELHMPVVAAGVKNLIIVSSPDGILVADKSVTGDMKRFTEGMSKRPMYEERRWGSYQVLDHRYCEAIEVLVKNINITAGKNISYQRHFHRSEVWTITAGEGWFADNDGIRQVHAGDILNISCGQWHGIKAKTALQFVEVQSGDSLIEEDIERRFMTWEEVEQHFSHCSNSINYVTAEIKA